MFNYLIPISMVCLFLPFKEKIGPIQVRPFDALVVLLVIVSIPYLGRILKSKVAAGFLLLLPFFILHVLSAFGYSSSNGMREFLQVLLVLSYAFLLSLHAGTLNYRLAGKVLLAGLCAVMLYNIGWHIEQGIWSGWKRLNDPKAAFTFLPMLLGVLLVFAPKEKLNIYWTLWWLAGVVILFSGERKALVAYGLLTAALLSRGRLLRSLPVLAAGVVALFIFAGVTDDNYLSRQIKTVLTPSSSQFSLGAIAAGEMPSSLSNAARRLQMQESMKMVTESPLFGAGTNANIEIMRSKYPGLPSFMRSGIHSEFLRVLAENGLVGLLLYCLILVAGTYNLARVLQYLWRLGLVDSAQARVLMIVLLLPPFMYISLEASGTRAIMAFIAISLMPLFVLRGVTAGGARAEPERAAADDRHLPALSGTGR